MNEHMIEKNLSKALIAWYDFTSGDSALFITGGNTECEVLSDVLREKGVDVTTMSAKELAGINEKYDYVVGAGIIEKEDDPVSFLRNIYTLIKPCGKLFLGTENRLGIRYFCGDKDAFSGNVYDGIEGYANVSEDRQRENGRAYSKAELAAFLKESGFVNHKFYSVMPVLARPQMLVSEQYIPNEPINIRIFPQYNSPETIFLEEERLYETLIENGMFHPMANAYLVECAVDDSVSDYDQITVQGDRAQDEALATMIKYGKEVRKRALYPEGNGKVQEMLEKNIYLTQHNVPVVAAHIEDESYVMPYVDGIIATEYFQNILKADKDCFLEEFGKFRDYIINSSEHVPYEDIDWQKFEPYWEKRKEDDPNIDRWRKLAFGTKEEQKDIGVILKRGFVDMVSLNCFHTDSGFLFFDQEFCVDNLPANVILVRTVDMIYRSRYDLELLYPRDELMRHFDLLEHVETWRKYTGKFLGGLRNEKELLVYHRIHRRDSKIMISNRHRMNYSQEEYDKLFSNIFKNAENKKIFLFGSGQYAMQFIDQFGKYYKIAGIVDNNCERWGQKLKGIEISSPSILKSQDEAFKVFICIKYFDEVLMQLKKMGVKDFSVYDSRLEYDKPLRIEAAVGSDKKFKKYHIGYVAGVFDLFHIGHLNLLRRAKEQCDYLIVGVVTDEQVIKGKRTKPYMSFNDRLEIVKACRYVDEAVEIPEDRYTTEDAYHMYHFDVQFSGSDYENDPIWLAQRAFLRRHGSDIIFFPYTLSVSSTQIKKEITHTV